MYRQGLNPEALANYEAETFWEICKSYIIVGLALTAITGVYTLLKPDEKKPEDIKPKVEAIDKTPIKELDDIRSIEPIEMEF